MRSERKCMYSILNSINPTIHLKTFTSNFGRRASRKEHASTLLQFFFRFGSYFAAPVMRNQFHLLIPFRMKSFLPFVVNCIGAPEFAVFDGKEKCIGTSTVLVHKMQ